MLWIQEPRGADLRVHGGVRARLCICSVDVRTLPRVRMEVRFQLKPSKWPVRMRSPMGEGARLGRPVPAAMVARLVLRGEEVSEDVRSTAGLLGGTRSTGAVGAVVLICGMGGCSSFVSTRLRQYMECKAYSKR